MRATWGPPSLVVFEKSYFAFLRKHRRVDNLAAHDRQQRRSSPNLLNGYGHEILIENGEVGELAVFECPTPHLIEAEPRAVYRIKAQRFFAAGRFVRATRRSPPTVLPSSIH